MDQIPFDLRVFIAAVLCIFVLLVLLLRLLRWLGRRVRLERKPLLTPTETRFYRQLQAACPDVVLAPQVAMGALLRPRKGLGRKAWARSRSQIAQKIVDFAIVDPASGFVMAIVELDDRTHDARKDAVRDAMLAQGGYRVVRFHATERLTPDDIRDRIGALRAP